MGHQLCMCIRIKTFPVTLRVVENCDEKVLMYFILEEVKWKLTTITTRSDEPNAELDKNL